MKVIILLTLHIYMCNPSISLLKTVTYCLATFSCSEGPVVPWLIDKVLSNQYLKNI